MNKVFLPIMAALLLAGCSQKADNAEATPTDSDSIQCEEVEADEDESVPTGLVTKRVAKKEGLRNWTYSFVADYPVDGNPMLVNSIREWISETLGGTYTGNLADTTSMFDHYAKEYLTDDDETGTDSDEEFSFDGVNESEFTIIWQNDKLVTYQLKEYWYGGGAHGGTFIAGFTFRKSDGRLFGSDMFMAKADLQKELHEGLATYFGATTDEELEQQLFLSNYQSVSNLPMPKADPWIDGEGVHLVYGEYEIACYAAGLPEVIIPLNRAKKYFTATVLKEL